MDRRHFILSVPPVLAGVLGGGLLVTLPSPVLADTDRIREVIEACLGCVRAGDACVAHCAMMLGNGDTSMADCNKAVHNMLATCRAMADIASYGTASPANLKALAAACASFCRACEKACEPHAGHHEACKACMESCHRCARACEALAA